MSYSVGFHPFLEDDLLAIAGWYEDQNAGLGEEFICSFERTVEKVRVMPLAYPVFKRRFRKVRVDRFPFILIYSVGESMIIFKQLVHGSRHPRRFTGR